MVDADLVVLLAVIIIAVIVGIPIFYNFVVGLVDRSCERITESDIKNNLEFKAQQAVKQEDINVLENPSENITFNGSCVERVYSKEGALFVKFKSQDVEKKFSNVEFVVEGTLIVNPGTYGVKIYTNKIVITKQTAS